MNAFNYVVPHAKSLSSCSVSFDGATNEAVIANDISLTNYVGVNWILGEESTDKRTFDNTDQNMVSAYLDSGGKLIVSGAEIGWDLGRANSPNASLSFYQNYLKATYQGDDSESFDIEGANAGIFNGVAGSFDDGTSGIYLADYADRLGPTGGSSVVLSFTDGTGDEAAVAYKGTDFGVVNFGFPLETITYPAVRDTLICSAINYLDIGLLDCPPLIIENGDPIQDSSY